MVSPAVGSTTMRRDRTYALALLLVTIALVYVVAVHWWFTAPLAAARENLVELRDQEARLRQTALLRPAVEARLQQVRTFEAGNPGFLPESSFDLAAAGLIQRIQTLVSERNAGPACTVLASSPFAANTKEPYIRVTIKVTLRCEIDHFAAILHGLESGSPQVFVADFNANGRRIFMPGVADPGGYIDFRFDLYGYLRQQKATSQ